MSSPTPDPRRWKALTLLSIVQFMVILDTSIVTVALPTIQRALHYSETDLQWVINAYVLVFGSLLLVGGRAADLFGRRRVFVAGMVVFGLASLACGLAPTSAVLVGARVVQGIGGAIVSPAALAIITDLFRDPGERNKAMGIWGASAPAGGAAGVLLGGVFTSTIGWRWVFFVNVPVTVLALLAVPALLDRGLVTGRRPRLDLPGALAVTGGLVLAVYAIISADSTGFASGQFVGLMVAALVLLALFLVIESRTREPLVPLSLFRGRNLTGGTLVLTLIGAAWIPTWYYISFYMQQVLGYGALKAGLAYLPMTLLIVAISVLGIARLVGKFGFKPNLLVGLAALAAGAFLFARAATGGVYAADILPASLILGIGMGLGYVPAVIASLSEAEPEVAGLASGIINTAYQIGSALGLAVVVAVATSRTTQLQGAGTAAAPALNGGFHAGFAVAGGIAVAALALGLLVIRRPRPAAVTPAPVEAEAAAPRA